MKKNKESKVNAEENFISKPKARSFSIKVYMFGLCYLVTTKPVLEWQKQ